MIPLRRIFTTVRSLESRRFFTNPSVREVLTTFKEGDDASIRGWVEAVRKLKGSLFVDLNDGSSSNPLQVVISKEHAPKNLNYGCSVEVKGTISSNPNNQIEIKASSVQVLGECDLNKGYPFTPRKSYPMDYMRQYLHLRPRTRIFSALSRIRHEASLAVHEYFDSNGFCYIHTPILTSNDCEGAGEVFVASPENEELTGNNDLEKDKRFFGDKSYLTVSGQFHLEVMSRCLNKVYNFGPTFRAENSKSRLHLSEFYMIEAETAFTSSIDVTVALCEGLVKYVANNVLNSCSEDIYKVRVSHEGVCETNLDKAIDKPFLVICYEEAIDILLDHQDQLSTKCKPGESLTKEQELFLVRHVDQPLFVINWPRSIKPFYMKASGDLSHVFNFDLLCPNVGEVCGGSLREDDYSILEESLKKDGLQASLDWYLELRKFGNSPTGGFGVGFERLIMALTGVSNIKDVIPFPRWPHSCKM